MLTKASHDFPRSAQKKQQLIKTCHLPCILSTTCPSHHKCIRASSVSSGWKLVAKTLPCLTAMMSFSSPRATVPNTSTRSPSPAASPDNMVSTTGALMKTPGKGRVAVESSPSPPDPALSPRKGSSRSAWKLCTCRPKWLRCARTCRPPTSSWPPFLAPVASSARRIKPAQVPQVDLRSTLFFPLHVSFCLE